jgi:hypothetical protein
MTDRQTRFVPWCTVGTAIRAGRRRTAGGALALALLAPTLAGAQGPTPAPAPLEASGGTGFLHEFGANVMVLKLVADELGGQRAPEHRIRGQVEAAHAPWPRKFLISYRPTRLGSA